MDLKERVRYLQGLAAGLQTGEESPTARVLNGMLGVLEQVASELHQVANSQAELEAYVRCVDADLAEVERDLRGEEGLTCPECGQVLVRQEAEEEGSPEIVCPNCGVVIDEHREDFETVDDPEEITG